MNETLTNETAFRLILIDICVLLIEMPPFLLQEQNQMKNVHHKLKEFTIHNADINNTVST